MKKKSLLILVMASVSLCACTQTIPKEALELKKESLQFRQLQTRSFDTKNEKDLLIAGAGVLQDLGFNIEESETNLGVVVGSKDRDAVEAGQVAGAVLMAVMFGVNTPIDEKQKITASLITTPVGNNKTKLRITMQRIVWNTQGQVSKTQSIEEPEIYKEFFNKLSKAVFLTANEI